MIKIASLLLSALAFVLLSFFSGNEKNEVIVDQQLPRSIFPGQPFIITINISKGSNDGFARLLQTLPEGYTAKPIETRNAQFLTSGQEIKFIWTQLPEEPDFTIAYSVTPPVNQGNVFEVGGLFSYMKDDEITRFPVPIEAITLSNLSAQQTNETAPIIQRKMIVINPETGTYQVDLSIQAVKNQDATFIDRIPEGFTVKVVESSGATFRFDNQQVKFEWAALPVGQPITISYQVVSGKAETTAPKIDGMLVYNEANEIKGDVPSAPLASNTSNTTLKNSNKENLDSKIGNAHLEKVNQIMRNGNTPKGLSYKVQVLATRFTPTHPTSWVKNYYNLNTIR